MKVTNEELKALKDALTSVWEQESESARFSNIIGNAILALDPHFKALEQSERAIYLKYVEKDEEDQPVIVNGVPKFTDTVALEIALTELFAVEIEVPKLTQLSPSDFDAAKIKTSGKLMVQLKPLLHSFD